VTSLPLLHANIESARVADFARICREMLRAEPLALCTIGWPSRRVWRVDRARPNSPCSTSPCWVIPMFIR